MGGAVTIGLLMMTSGAMPKGLWISSRAWELVGAWLDVSPGPEVLALFGGTRRTDGYGGGEIGCLCVEYWCWGGLKGTLSSEDGTVKAWETWDGSWGVDALGRARCGRVCMAPSGAHHSWYGQEVDCYSSPWWPRSVDWWGICFTRWQWTLRNRGRLCEMVSWRPLNRYFEWLLASLLAIKWPLAFHIDVWLIRNGDCWYEIVMQKFSHWELLMWNIFALTIGSAKLMQNFSQWEKLMRNFSHCVRTENGRCENFHIGFLSYEVLYFPLFFTFPVFYHKKLI